MDVDKTRPGLVFKRSTMTQKQQRALLAEAGARHIHTVNGPWRELFRGVRVIRAGDTVYFVHLSAVPTERGGDELTPTLQSYEFLHEIERAKAVGIEVYTGRTTAKRRDFRAMVADANKVLTQGGPRRPPAGYAKRGAPNKTPPEDVFAKWIAIWKSDDYTTNDAALKAMGKPFVPSTAHKLFGPSGRPPGGHRDNAR